MRQPLTLVGIEHEYAVRDGERAVDFRHLIDALAIDGHRVDPRDWYARRCAWGGVITCDDAEAEIACPPVAVARGFVDAVVAWGERGHRALRDAVPAHLDLAPYSTHVSVSASDPIRIAHRLVTTVGPALIGDRCGIIVRPRPGRVEVCFEGIAGDELRDAVAVVTGAVVALERDLDALGPPLPLRLDPGLERPGWYLDRRHATANPIDCAAIARRALGSSTRRRRPELGTTWTRVLRPELLSITWDVAVFADRDGVVVVPATLLDDYLDGALDDELRALPRRGRLRAWAQISPSAPVAFTALDDPIAIVRPELDGPLLAVGRGKVRPPGQLVPTTPDRPRIPWWVAVVLVLVVVIGVLVLVGGVGGDDDEASVASTTVTTTGDVVGAAPRDLRITAVFDQATYSTYYDVAATDPDGDALTYDWELQLDGHEDCGVFTSDGSRAQWQHPHESQRGLVPGFPDDRYCQDSAQQSGGHPGRIVVIVSDRTIECVVAWDRGSEAGELTGLTCR